MVRGTIAPAMNDNNKTSLFEPELHQLEQRVNDLLALVHQLAEENRALRHRQDTLSTERAALLQKNEQVRGRVEAMIGRLRTMETGA
jgi:cell division protein ZapB